METVEPGSATDRASLIAGVFPVLWGPAQILLGGDVIKRVTGRAIETLDDSLAAVGALKIGDTVSLEVWRDGETIALSATIGERPSQETDLWIDGRR